MKKVFPWGQAQGEAKEWIMRFGLIPNNSGNCDVWVDLGDDEPIPLVSTHQLYVQLTRI